MTKWTKLITILSLPVFLTGCIATMSQSEMNQAHLNCGIGSAPIETYRSCLANVYQQNGGISEGRLEVLLAADQAAESVKLGKMTRSEGYSYIAKIRGESTARQERANAQRRKAWSEAMDSYQQQQNNIYNSLLNSQRRTTNCRSTVIGNTVNTNCY